MHALGVPNCPISWQSIRQRFTLNVPVACSTAFICNGCGQLASDANAKSCSACDSHFLVSFHYYPLVEQIQQVLLIPGVYQKMKKQRAAHRKDFQGTYYGKILANETDDTFTMIVNIDGVVTKNKHLSLWPITFMLNEIPFPFRRYCESILIGGAIAPTKHPSNKLFRTILNILADDLRRLEDGVTYVIPNESKRDMKFFLIGSCTDKPAQSLITNMVSSNACFSCPKCLIEGKFRYDQLPSSDGISPPLGETFRGESKRKRPFNVKVFPFGSFPLRSHDDYQVCATTATSTNNSVRGLVGKKCVHSRTNEICLQLSNFLALGLCPLTSLKYYSLEHSVLFDSLHTLYLGVFKKLCLLWFSNARDHRRQKWSLFSKIDSIDEGLAAVRTPTTTSRRFRSVKEISNFKANELRSLMHQGSTVLLQAMVPKYRKHFALLLAAVNTASKDTIQAGDVTFIRDALKKFVQDWQKIFGLRHMTSNVHSLLHMHESIASLGPLYMYSTFNFEGKKLCRGRPIRWQYLILLLVGPHRNRIISLLSGKRFSSSLAIRHDLVSMTHGTTHYGQQLLSNLLYYRDAIIETGKLDYPLKLFMFTQQLLSRKSSREEIMQVKKKVANNMYADEFEHLKLISNRTFVFYEQLTVKGIVYKTLRSIRSKKFSDCCVSFQFGSAVKFGLIRAVVQDEADDNQIFLLLEDLVEEDGSRSEQFLQVKTNANQASITPHIYIRSRSHSFILRSPSSLLRKNAYRILSNGETIEIIEYSNLKESS